ncbi:type VI secretion system Vgr family protein [Pantoea sp. FN060301]|uniref:type VI secretion system Vgr family protein n=1 Tax=Pantoea sp. FN060301 TaxID=3420380 RepID=UPI003D181B49
MGISQIKEIASFHSLNRYHLSIQGCDALTDVEDFQGQESLSELYRYRIRFTSPNPDIPAVQALRKSTIFTMRTLPETILGTLQPPVTIKTVHGVVTAFRRLKSSPDQTLYELDLEPFLALLRRQVRSHRFFVDRSVPEVVEQVLKEHGLKGWEYEFRLKADYPQREQINQYQESDLAFVERLLSEVGIHYFFTLQPDTQTEVIHFSDNAGAWTFGKKLPLSSPSGMNDGGTVSAWMLKVEHDVVAASVMTGDYNPHQAQLRQESAPADMTRGDGEGVTYGEEWRYGTRHAEPGDRYSPKLETGNFYARLEHERLLCRRTRISGRSNDALLGPAQVITLIDQAVPPELPAVLNEQLTVVSVVFIASRKNALQVEFTATPWSETCFWRPEAKARPVVKGTLMARITSAKENDLYAWQDASGLYRVRFDADRDDKAAGLESMPVRLAKPYGGDMYGFHFPLVQGTEVAIAFHNGDPDRPYIAHALHDSRHPDHVTEKNSTRNVIRTPANNKLRMEDRRGEEHIKLGTEYGGKTQLNIGHNVDAQRALRGEGAELRTDAHVAIRGGKGVFITADKQPLADGQMLAMEEATARLKQAAEQMRALSDDAKTAKAEPAQLEAQLAFMREQIEKLQEAVTLIGAPKGIALASGQHLQLAASRNLIFNAGANADMGVMKRLFIGVGEGLSLFVRKLGVRLIANQGAVTVQAQNDQMQLLAKQGLEIVSTDDEIHLVAKKKITLNAGGSYITLDPYRIELGTKGDFAVRAADFDYSGPAGMAADHPDYPALQASARQLLRLRLPQTANASSSYAGMPYTLYADGALLSKGVLDESGQLEIDHQVVTRSYRLVMANGASYHIPVVSEYRNAKQGTLANLGLHNHTPQTGDGITSPEDHTVHRNLYAGLLQGLNDREETDEPD